MLRERGSSRCSRMGAVGRTMCPPAGAACTACCVAWWVDVFPHGWRGQGRCVPLRVRRAQRVAWWVDVFPTGGVDRVMCSPGGAACTVF
jgi:hypothetical protein